MEIVSRNARAEAINAVNSLVTKTRTCRHLKLDFSNISNALNARGSEGPDDYR